MYYVCMYVHVCIQLCMYVCSLRMYVGLCTYACILVSTNVCMHSDMYVCVTLCVYMHVFAIEMSKSQSHNGVDVMSLD